MFRLIAIFMLSTLALSGCKGKETETPPKSNTEADSASSMSVMVTPTAPTMGTEAPGDSIPPMAPGQDTPPPDKTPVTPPSTNTVTSPPANTVTSPPANNFAAGTRLGKTAIIKGQRAFALKLLSRLARQESAKNIVFSPLSISTAIAMVYIGSGTSTKKEIATLLGYSPNFEENSTVYGGLLSFENTRGFEVQSANRIFVHNTLNVKPAFESINRKFFRTTLQKLDFKQKAKVARTINSWISKQTKKKIKELVKTKHITPLTRMLLVNALYMKADWVHTFKKRATREMAFRSPSGKVKTKFMTQTTDFRYAEDSDMQYLEMPYKGRRLSMLVALPRKGRSLDSLLPTLSTSLNKARGGLFSQRVMVSFPKFGYSQGTGLKGLLKAMGMTLSFSMKADFGGISKTALKIEDVLHKARINVDEQGTVASAATAVIVGTKGAGMSSRPVTFVADHPFAYFIVDRLNNTILFAGIIRNPTLK
ncbi:hypothetical protein KKF84_13195 [Myxococcota bacterium]|nr:hypothetical protein [Myxococcota bacterium]